MKKFRQDYVNYWKFQCNPNLFNLKEKLTKGDVGKNVKTWLVNQHRKNIRVGDKVVLWVTRKNRGCYALAEVTSEVRYEVNEFGDHHVDIKIEHNFGDDPIFLEGIKDNFLFKNVTKPFMGTNTTITEQEYEGLLKLRN